MDIKNQSTEKLIEMLRQMVLIRHLEESLNNLFARGLLHGTSHLYIGQEAVAVGACFPLKEGDLVASTHRGHGHALARGVDLKKLAAELLGKDEGLCRGRGGTQHLSDIKAGFLGTNGITGGFIPIATGAALSFTKQKKDNVVLSFFGDGASNTGYFHESLNFASIHNLPVIFICENNLYAMSVPAKKAVSVPHVADRAAAYSMEGVVVDGMDPIAVEKVMTEAIDKARKGCGPTLVEAETYRYLGHSKSDRRVYRTREEEKLWRMKDPIDVLGREMVESNLADRQMVDKIEADARGEVDAAMEWALNLPDPPIDNVKKGLFSPVEIGENR